MSSAETRSTSALFKRAKQLERWNESDTSREPTEPKRKSRKITFTDGCVFLAACASGDKEEVLRLVERGADIDTANVDGLTALHQVQKQADFDQDRVRDGALRSPRRCVFLFRI
jgi:protein phosphatase 1 regulatory subunit 12A